MKIAIDDGCLDALVSETEKAEVRFRTQKLKFYSVYSIKI